MAPAATPPATVRALNAVFARALADPAVRQRIAELGAIPLGGTPEEMNAHVQGEAKRWAEVVKRNNIRAE
jgi:tripartite-type tricarboxylate transporter receptor subunit TctC